MGSQLHKIKDQDDNVLGHVELGEYEIPMWDFALTPIVSAVPPADLTQTVDQREPRIVGFLACPRTSLDTRPREQSPPYDHIGEETRLERIQRVLKEHEDNHLGLDGTLLTISDIIKGKDDV